MLTKWSSVFSLLLLLASPVDAGTATRFQNDVIISGNTTAKQALTVTGNETVGGTLGVTGNSTFAGTLGVTGLETVGGSCTVTGDGEFGGSLAVGKTSSADASSILEMVSTSKGMLPPRMTQSQRDAISSPALGLVVFNTDTNSLNVYNGSSWAGVGSGGGGSKNYITYGDAETNSTTGWSLTHSTLDSTSLLPNQTSGSWTSASGNLSFAIDGTNVLSGTKSYKYVSSAASVAGDMLISQAYTLDTSDQAHSLQIKMNYKMISGASNVTMAGGSSDSFGVAIYDRTNNAWISPTVPWIYTGASPALVTFQTPSNMTSFSVAVYNITASGGSFQLDLDDISVGPQISNYGPFITDWKAFAPTGSWTTNTTYSGFYKIIGDTMYVKEEVSTSGAPNAVALTLDLPSGKAIDTSKVNLNTADNPTFGLAVGYSGSSYNFDARVAGNSSTTSVSVFYMSPDATDNIVINGGVSSTAPFTFGSGGHVIVEYSVPLAGASSNTIQSSEAGNSGPVAAFYTTSETTSIGNGASVTIFASGASVTKVIETSGNLDTSNGEYTVSSSGIYEVASGIFVNQFAGQRNVNIYFQKNDVTQNSVIDVMNGSASTTQGVSGSSLIKCNAGDKIRVQVYQTNSGAASASLDNSDVGAISPNWLSIHKVNSGSQVIQASDSVSARYFSTSGQSFANNSATVINFDSKDFDSTSSVTTGSGWKFTAPISGTYIIDSQILWSNSNATGERVIYFSKNGGTNERLQSVPGTTQSYPSLSPHRMVKLNAGEYIQLLGYQNSGGSLALAATDAIQSVYIYRVGN